MKERIAVFGMGQMGANMASRLTEQGFDVLGYDINPARRQELASILAEPLHVPAEQAEQQIHGIARGLLGPT